ncbi:hypothetical protein HU200_036586 [Digitaria exilis]|uniref:Uncharacterized protein n=1 Tax=Digitaria exilis TaxID=1010633 RepID=A0A835BDN2_9POAL|nr:hypothetical protein HU200_036586 [Digitaria exilis]CAB3477652.1 unnamed protein product [Digitaria exilis]
MSRKHHDPEVARSRVTARDGSSKAVWDTGSSLYDSYELAAVHRLLDAAAGVLPLTTDDETQAAVAAERTDKSNKKQAVVAVRPRRKVTLRALFRAVATWAARPRQAPLACACAGMVHAQGGSAVDPDLASHGEL